jgi:glycosyltransferase involved in cell wall biosynthesis
MRRRILLVVNDASFFLSHRLVVARGAASAGFDVHVVTPNGPDVGRVRDLGFEHHAIPLSRAGTHPHQELASIAELGRIYRHLRPALTHHVTIKPVLYGSLCARALGVRAVVNAISGLGHVFQGRRARTRALRAALAPVYRFALGHPNSAVIFQNEGDRDLFVENGWVTAARAKLIRGSGVDLDAFTPTPLPPGPPVVVFCGRILRDKGVGEFVEAAARLKLSGRNARFVIVGGVDEHNPSAVRRDEVERWVADGTIEWWGFRSDVAEVMRAASIVCLPSYGEGVPKVLLEAAASARPMVVSDIPGCREVVRDQVDGLIVPVRDAASLAAALDSLIGAPDRCARFGAEARRSAEASFDERGVVARTLAIYEELLAHP